MTSNTANLEARVNLIRPMTVYAAILNARNAILNNCQNCTKQDLSDLSSSYPGSSKKSDYKIKRLNKKKISSEKCHIKLCAKLTAKLLMTVYKLMIITLKLDEDPLQCRIYFISFIESLDMIFSHYKETCEVLSEDPEIGWEDLKCFVKKAIRNILHASIDFHSRSLIDEFPEDGVKCISKLQSHCANMTFSEKVGMIDFFNKYHIE